MSKNQPVRLYAHLVNVLGISVGQLLIDKWHGWLMPVEQPFIVPRPIARGLGLTGDRERLTPELRDSFLLYGLAKDQTVCWLTRSQSRRLPEDVRRSQPASHHWPIQNEDAVARLGRLVERRRRPSRHLEVDENVWRRASDVLPGARILAGTFPSMSGPNCFGTVMGAAGVTGVADTWLQREQFEAWLAVATREGGQDQEPGTILVWRGNDRSVQHAAVTLGEGWALHKPSQGWMSPTMVLDVSDAKFSSRSPGLHLHRRRIAR